MKPLVIYHADCTDGFGAAFAAWLKLGNDAEYYAARYGADQHKTLDGFLLSYYEVKDRDIYILDFSFPRETMDWLFARAKRLVWLDHHASVMKEWGEGEEAARAYDEAARKQWGLFARTNFNQREPFPPNAHVVLDNNKSGALLAWEYFHPGAAIPKLIQHIDDRDRWQFKLDGSKELHAALQSYKPWNFEQWSHLRRSCEIAPGHFFTAGAAILRAQEQHVERMAKQARKCEIFSVTGVPFGINPKANMRQHNFAGLAVNAPIHQSEIGHELANQSSTYGLVWYMGVDNRVKCSLRSNGEYDVSAIARAFGGGGHRNAAGFEIDIQTLIQWLK